VRNALGRDNDRVMIMAALILVISAAAFIQFCIFSWRAALLTVAAKPLSDQVHEALAATAGALESGDFLAARQLLALSPSLAGGDRSLLSVGAYFTALRSIKALAGWVFPFSFVWTKREMAACTRFAAVVLDERLQRNRQCIAEICSY